MLSFLTSLISILLSIISSFSSSSKENCLNVARNLIQIVDEFFENEISEEEINYAKQHLCGEEIMAGEDMEQRMKQMARCWFSGYNQNSSENILKIINEIQQYVIPKYSMTFLTKEDTITVICNAMLVNVTDESI